VLFVVIVVWCSCPACFAAPKERHRIKMMLSEQEVQSVAECCRVLQCSAVCCSVLQCVAVCSFVLRGRRSGTASK